MEVEGLVVCKKSHCGRPPGRKKTSKIEVSIEPEIKELFMNILHKKGKTASTELCSWIRNYIAKELDGGKKL